MEIKREVFENNGFKLSVAFLFILLALIILVTDSIDTLITNLLWPLLEGSSEGKTVIFLGIIGSFNNTGCGN
jgi:hypothetical protein